MSNWAEESFFYHIYPLGLTGAPARNDFHSTPVPRLEQLYGWLNHIQWLGADAIYLGPVFESTAHGYDTVDYFHVDRRLGSDETLAAFAAEVHRRGMRLVLDGVFNHVGRNFWAFHDVREHGEASPYKDWFHNLRFGEQSPCGDPFTYEGWAGYYDLVKLNLKNPAVVDPSAASRHRLDRALPDRRYPSGRRRRGRHGLPANPRGALPPTAPRFLADGRDRAW